MIILIFLTIGEVTVMSSSAETVVEPKEVFLFKYSHIAPANMPASVLAYAQATNLTSEAVLAVAVQQGAQYNPNQGKNEEFEGKAIPQFKMGAIDEPEFHNQMRAALGVSIDTINDEKSRECWNAMSTLEAKDWQLLAKLASLKSQYGFLLAVSANTNRAHREWLEVQLSLEHQRQLEGKGLLPVGYEPQDYSTLIDFAAYSDLSGCFDPEPAIPPEGYKVENHCHSKGKADIIVGVYVLTEKARAINRAFQLEKQRVADTAKAVQAAAGAADQQHLQSIDAMQGTFVMNNVGMTAQMTRGELLLPSWLSGGAPKPEQPSTTPAADPATSPSPKSPSHAN